ncbi:MAG: SDR family oxidoreductase [Verrucomicrobia bacterium]|nr:SDR family oxidoreductase [Verrucomicrobiota bacterium]
MKHILVTGGCGYTGTPLTQKLLEAGHQVTVFDTQWFGNHLVPHPNLTLIKGDVRNVKSIPLDGMDVVFHLANIANDPAVDLDPSLSWEVNALVAMQLADQAVRKGVKQFVFASSGSVYGVKEEERVTEDLELVPISVYNKTKMVAERVLLSYTDAMTVHCVRPATVCGYSPRMRLDVAVNMLTFQALQNKRITVFGGDQTRPNIHIADLVDVYIHLLDHPAIASGCYNAGFENISILEIAQRVTALVPAEIVVSPSNDPRSYRLDSGKLLATGFAPKRSVSQAIQELIVHFQEGVLRDDGSHHNVKWMQKLISNSALVG